MNESGKQRSILSNYFPMIRTRDKVLQEIAEKAELNYIFYQWDEKSREDFLDFCTGMRGVKILYDGFFKEIFNPEIVPERLEEVLTLLMKEEIRIECALPNDSVRLGAESSLLYTDIVVQQKDGGLSNVEIQKIGYAFPGQRSACYSADHLLRQYKRVRGERGVRFRYQDVKKVNTVVFFERSPKEFKEFPDEYLHVFRQKSDTGVEMDLLQEYVFVALDNFKKAMENKSVNSKLEAWLMFLSFDEPERIVELITRFPEFKALYQEIYELCLNTERVMSMYSKELERMDRNTALGMLDDLHAELELAKDELDQTKGELDQTKGELDQAKGELTQKRNELDEKDNLLADKERIIKKLKEQLAEMQKENK